MAIGGGVIGAFYSLGKNIWSSAEYYYEGAFYLVTSLILSFVSAALLRVGKLQEKWRVKLAETLRTSNKIGAHRGTFKQFAEKYAIFILTFFTVSREGIEGILFIAGVSFSAPAKSIPLPVVIGVVVGAIIGWILYR